MKKKLTNKQYDVLKAITLYVLPFLGFILTMTTLVVDTFDIPNGAQIVALVTGFNAAFGVFIAKISANYAKEHNIQNEEEIEE